MREIPLYMKLDKFNDYTQYTLSQPYHFTTYTAGDENIWAEIMVEAKEFSTVENAKTRFITEFKENHEFLSERCIFIEDEHHHKIATIIAAEGNARNRDEGRIHWVAIRPSHQGLKLSKPLVAKALHILNKNYKSAYLKTTSEKLRAIKVYRDLGFEPLIINHIEISTWNMILKK